jgi:hypothetical protein
LRPLPEDISKPDTTYQIVAKIRCEARDAVRRKAIVYLQHSKDTRSAKLGDDLESGLRTFASVQYSELAPTALAYVKRYENIAIAYEFTIDIVENNNNSATINLFNPFSNGKRTAALGGGIERQRENSRNFRVADNFGDLARNLSDDYCKVKVTKQNHIYPILGKIGLAEVIDTFIDLNQSGNIAPKEGGTVNQLADTIDFTTKLTGSVSPTIELTPITSGLGISSATLENTTDRTDKHKLVFALSLPPGDVEEVSSAPARRKRVTAKTLAVDELDRQQNRDLTDTLRILRRQTDTLE